MHQLVCICQLNNNIADLPTRLWEHQLICVTDRDIILFIDNASALSACVHGYARNTDLAAMSKVYSTWLLLNLNALSGLNLVTNLLANIADLPTRPQDANAANLCAQLSWTQDTSLRLPTLDNLKTPRMQHLFVSCRS